jgi:YD repeat-containing protein
MTVIKREYHPNGVVSFEETQSGHKTYFNESGKKIRHEFLDQVDVWNYNEDGLLTHWKHAFDKDCWREYDENNRLIREWQDGGYDGRWEYDDKGRIARFYDVTDASRSCWYVYNNDDKLLCVCRTQKEYLEWTAGEESQDNLINREIHFYESMNVLPEDKCVIHDWESINEILRERKQVGEVHTTQMCMLSTTWILSGYRVFVHQGNGIVYEITLRDKDHQGDRAIRIAQNMYAMWAGGVFRE